MHKLSRLAEDPGRTLTADLCDKYEHAQVIPGPFANYGRCRACIGEVDIISTHNDNSLVSDALNGPGNGRILIVDNAGSTDCAMVGGNLARAAHENGWLGIIVHGAIRDVVELEQAPIVIFARATCPRKSDKRGVGVRGKAADLAGVLVHPGDIVAADPDGVIVIRATDFDES